MDLEQKISYVLEQLDRLDVSVRSDHLGGEGGGVCRLKDKAFVFIDLDAEPETRYATVLSALAELVDPDDLFLLPEIRNDLEESA